VTAFLADTGPASDLLDVFSSYDSGVLFRGLTQGGGGQPAILGTLGWIFTALGAFFTLWGFVLRSRRSAGEAKMDEVAKTWIVIAAMLAGPFLMRTAMQGADQVYESAVGGPGQLTAACVKAAYAMPELSDLFDVLRRSAIGTAGAAQGQAAQGRQALLSGANDGSVLGYLEAFGVALWDTGADYAAGAGQAWSGMVRMAAMATGFGSAMLKCLLIILTIGPLYLLLLASAAVIWFMWQLRYFLAVSGSMMLPLFIGMFSLPQGHPNRQPAQAYVMHMLSLALWPVAWAIGHSATASFYNALISLVAGTSRVPDLAGALQWDSLAAQGPSGAQVQAAEAALGNWFMGNVTALLSILVGGLGFAAWVAAVTILGPVFLHRLLATGALFFAQAAASSARQAAVAGRLAVGAAQEHGLVAAVLGGPGPGPGERLAEGAAAIAVPLVGGVEAGTAGAQGGVASMAMAARRVDVSDGKGGASV
jgi:hypothetical protein